MKKFAINLTDASERWKRILQKPGVKRAARSPWNYSAKPASPERARSTIPITPLQGWKIFSNHDQGFHAARFTPGCNRAAPSALRRCQVNVATAYCVTSVIKTKIRCWKDKVRFLMKSFSLFLCLQQNSSELMRFFKESMSCGTKFAFQVLGQCFHFLTFYL